MQNGAATERAEAFKAVKPGATVYPVDENANSDVETIIDEYDDFVFLNGNTCADALGMLKAKGKNVYAFDVYEEFLDELIAGNAHFKGIMAQNTFGMTVKAVDAIMAEAKQGETVPAFYITRYNLGDDSVKPFLDFYGKEAYPVIENLTEKIVGKWIHADTDDETVTTDMMSVYTFTSDGSALKGYYSMSMTESGVWANRQETDVTVSGNTITLTSHLADGTTSVVEMAGVNISGDDPEYESSEPYRELYRADGTCSYYDLIDGQWVEEETVLSEYFADGPLFCFRWQKPGKELRRENWEIISCENGKMVNKAFLRHADGTTYTITAHLTKVLEKV